MARAYAHCINPRRPDNPDGYDCPTEYHVYMLVKEYGIKAILGRDVARPRELRAWTIARNIITWYRDREASPNWGEWTVKHAEEDAVLNEVHKEYLKWQTEQSE